MNARRNANPEDLSHALLRTSPFECNKLDGCVFQSVGNIEKEQVVDTTFMYLLRIFRLFSAIVYCQCFFKEQMFSFIILPRVYSLW